MKGRRWDKARTINRSTPDTYLTLPNAWEIKLMVDRAPKFPIISIGPITPKQPVAQMPYDNYIINWTAQVVQYIDDPKVVSKYQATKAGPRTITITWRKGTSVLSTTSYNIVV